MVATFDGTAANTNEFLTLHDSAGDWWYTLLLHLILSTNFKGAKPG